MGASACGLDALGVTGQTGLGNRSDRPLSGQQLATADAAPQPQFHPLLLLELEEMEA